MRTFLYLLLFGLVLLTIGIVVRSGIFLRENPGQPINAAMRQAQAGNAFTWPDRDATVLAQQFAGARETESGMRYIVHAPGEGAATPKRGQLVTVHYTGRFIDGQQFDSSADHGGPFNFIVGENKVIPGWDEAFLSMKKGEKRTLIIPYWLAYGEKGIRGKIEPRATLIFDVELLDFK